MKKATLLFFTLSLLFACDSTSDKEILSEKSEIKNDKLTGFLLGGVYFFNGYGGTAAVYDMIKAAVKDEPGSEEFVDALDKSYTEIMVFPFGSDQEVSSKETLKQYWKITDKSTFMETQSFLLKSGHHDEFVIYKKMIDDNGGANADLTIIEAYRTDAEVKEKLAFIKNNYSQISSTGIKAWDYARYVNNICIGYSAGYITKNEGEKLINDLLLIVRNKYNDWHQYYSDYNMGRKYWGGDKSHDAEMEKTAKEMMEGDYSIYKYLLLKQ